MDVILRFKTEDPNLVDLLVQSWIDSEELGLLTRGGMDYVTLTYVKES